MGEVKLWDRDAKKQVRFFFWLIGPDLAGRISKRFVQRNIGQTQLLEKKDMYNETNKSTYIFIKTRVKFFGKIVTVLAEILIKFEAV